MRILFWQEVFWPQVGGLEAQAEWLLPLLRERGHEVIVVTRQDSSDLPRRDRWNDFSLHRFPFWRVLDSANPHAVLALQHEVDQLYGAFQPDIVHLSGFGPTALFALRAQRRDSPPLLASLHSSNTLTSGRATLIERTLTRADWVSACSPALLDEARRCVPAIEPRSSVVYNGVPAPAVPPAPLPFTSPRVLCLGHLADHKGYDLLVDAAPKLMARLPRLRFVIAGDGPARAALERRAHAAGVGSAVEFPGLLARAAVADLINSATVVVVPSRRESFGIVAVEAALLQRPVVATRVGGLPDVVAHGETGLLVEPNDSAALAEAIAVLLGDPHMAARMGSRAREQAEGRFALGSQCDAYEAIYQRIRTAPAVARERGATGREASSSCE